MGIGVFMHLKRLLEQSSAELLEVLPKLSRRSRNPLRRPSFWPTRARRAWPTPQRKPADRFFVRFGLSVCASRKKKEKKGAVKSVSSFTLPCSDPVRKGDPTRWKPTLLRDSRRPSKNCSFFSCVAKNLRVHSHLPACSGAAGGNSSGEAERSRQFSLRATKSWRNQGKRASVRGNVNQSAAPIRTRNEVNKPKLKRSGKENKEAR